MTRVKRGVTKRARRKRVIKKAKGYISHRKTNFRAAMEAMLHAGNHAFAGRRKKKGDFRRLWNVRVNAAVRAASDMSYSEFIGALKKNGIVINRKMLSELAINEPDVFQKVIDEVKAK